jgi:hypothetical protein
MRRNGYAVVASWAHDGQHLAGRLGSGAEVTSSNSIAFGCMTCMTRPRPMATLLLLAGEPPGVMAGALCEVDGDHVAALGVERRDDPAMGTSYSSMALRQAAAPPQHGCRILPARRS